VNSRCEFLVFLYLYLVLFRESYDWNYPAYARCKMAIVRLVISFVFVISFRRVTVTFFPVTSLVLFRLISLVPTPRAARPFTPSTLCLGLCLCLSVCLTVCLSVCRSVRLSACLSVACLFVCLGITLSRTITTFFALRNQTTV
jgi:hypothetical protein